MSKQPKIIVITGAESTGKSTLSEALAKHYNIPFIPEYARDYIQKLDRNYTYDDIEFIAKKQVELLNNALNLNPSIIILDTWLLITKIWFEEVFKKYPDWLDVKIKNIKIDLFLVCDTDLPWIADKVRENGGKNREYLHSRYIEEIKAYNFPFEIISGDGNNRINNALNFITNLK